MESGAAARYADRSYFRSLRTAGHGSFSITCHVFHHRPWQLSLLPSGEVVSGPGRELGLHAVIPGGEKVLVVQRVRFAPVFIVVYVMLTIT